MIKTRTKESIENLGIPYYNSRIDRALSHVYLSYSRVKKFEIAQCAEARNINMNKNWRRFTISLIISVWQLTKYPSSLSDNLFNKINIIKEF